MTERAFEPGVLLANRYRVLRDRPAVEGALHVLDARDELSAGAMAVRLVLVPASSAGELESAVRRAFRYSVGVRGLAELIGVSEVEAGLQVVAYARPEGETLDDVLEQAGGALEPVREARISAELGRILEPLHQQGISHGNVCPELVVETSSGEVRLLGFGLAQAERERRRAHSPALDVEALAALSKRMLAGAPIAPPPESPPAPEAPEPAPPTASPPPAAPPPPPSVAPSPSDSRRVDTRRVTARRSWLAFAAIALGALVMVGGVATSLLIARSNAPPTSTTSSHAPSPIAPPLPPPAPPAPVPEQEDAGALPPEPSSTPPAAELSPPLPVKPPAEHRAAALPVDEKVPTWGPWEAPVTLTSFADLECPHTRALLPELVRLKSELGNDLRWVFRHRPLSQHADAEPAARLLAAVNEELGGGAFWKLVTELAKHPESDPNEVFETWFAQAGLDGALRARLDASPAARLAVERDVALGARLMVRATPAMFINGTRVEGVQSGRELLEAARKERRAALFTLLSGVEPANVYRERTLRNFVNLGDDPTERACVPSKGAPARGSENAPVTIVQYCAFESKYCRQAEPALSALLARHPAQVRIVWKSFPVADDAEGKLAANFALAARRAGGDAAFWAVHRALLDAQATLDAPALVARVRQLGLDAEGLEAAARAGAHDDSIRADVKLGRRLGVTGVPTYFVNGTRRDGLLSLAELETLVRDELVIAKRVTAMGRGPVDELACSALGR